MSLVQRSKHGRRAHGLAVLGIASAVLAATALPAGAHASFSSSAAFGFAPNVSGGTGVNGAAPPYVPGSTQTLYTRVPNENTTPFNGKDDTTIDVKIEIPTGWTDPVCGTANKNVNDASTNNTNQPGADVVGWTCEVITANGHQVVHFAGPQADLIADSAQFYSFDVTVPIPAAKTTYNGTNGTEGFIVDQQYASGEITHWIPNEAYQGNPPPSSTTEVAAGLARTVDGPGDGFQPVTPTRILDSRGSTGGWSGPLVAGTPQNLTVTGGPASVPVDATAIVANVTSTNSTANSFLTVYPAGVASVPNASNLNFGVNQTIPNQVTVQIGAGGQISFATANGATDVVVDLLGYYSAAAPDLFNGLDNERVIDSRIAFGLTGPVVAGSPQEFHAHVGGVPETADSIVMNVTATAGTEDSFLKIYPMGVSSPNISNLNFAAGETIANLVSVKLGTDGHLIFENTNGSVQVVADMVGYYDASGGNRFHPLAPSRILDSRTPVGGWNTTPLNSALPKELQITGFGGVRLDAVAVIGNVTATNSTANSFLTVWTGDTISVPNASNVNFGAGQTIPNLTQPLLGAGGSLSFATFAGSTDVVYDVVGYFTPVPA